MLCTALFLGGCCPDQIGRDFCSTRPDCKDVCLGRYAGFILTSIPDRVNQKPSNIALILILFMSLTGGVGGGTNLLFSLDRAGMDIRCLPGSIPQLGGGNNCYIVPGCACCDHPYPACH
jgi:hypothetical protein